MVTCLPGTIFVGRVEADDLRVVSNEPAEGARLPLVVCRGQVFAEGHSAFELLQLQVDGCEQTLRQRCIRSLHGVRFRWPR